MADLGVYIPHEEEAEAVTSDEQDQQTQWQKEVEQEEQRKQQQDIMIDVPMIVVHNEEDETNIYDEPPPYTSSISQDPESYYDTSSMLDDHDVVTDSLLLQMTMTEAEEEEEDQNPIEESMSPEEQQQQEEEDELLVGVSLSPLDRLLKFSTSKMVLQRLVVTRELSNTIHEVSLADAVEKILPVIMQLSKDTDDSVKEALAGELDKIIYFYYENAPPRLSTVNDQQQQQEYHIPANAFAATIIDFLLDQNTTLASIAQQSIVTVAAELAETAQDNARYEFNQALLNAEIYEGIILGLISIVNSGNTLQQQQKEEEEEKETKGGVQEDVDMVAIGDTTANDETSTGVMESFSVASTAAPDAPTTSKDDNTNTTTAVVEKKPNTVSELSSVISSATTAILKHYDDGGINLAKMVCLMLISALAQVFGPEGCTEKFLPIVESMVSDQMFYVRKEAAAAVGSLSTAVPPSVTLERLLPLYLKLSIDTIWHVRRSCVFALSFLCEVLPKDVRVTIAVEGVELFKNDVSRNVRNSLADITGEVISKFLPLDWKETGQPGEVPEELLEFFLSLGNSSNTTNGNGTNQMFKMDTERIHNCAYNFPAVVLTAGVQYWDSHLKDTYLNLTKDYQLKVRRTFAYSLHDIARIIGPERTERDLVQIFALYLMDLDDVKQGVLEHLSEFLSVLAISSRNEYIPILAEVWDGVMSNWHLRDILANQLRDIAMLFDASRVVEHILPLAIRACHDEYAAVRETGVEIFPVILDIVKRTVDEDGETLSQLENHHESATAAAVKATTAEGQEEEDDEEEEDDDIIDRQQKYALALLNHVMEKLDDLVRSSAYRTRLVFTQICRSLLDAGINPADFASFFLPRLVSLAKDPVVNVRIATSRTIHTLCSIAGYRQDLENIVYSSGEQEEEELNPGQVLDQILYYLTVDKDRDVRYFVSEFVSAEALERYQAKKVEQDAEAASRIQQAEEEDLEEEEERGEPSYTSLPPPPTPPVHLIMIHHSPPPPPPPPPLSNQHNIIDNSHNDAELPIVLEDVEEEDIIEEDDDEGEEIYHSTESPMDIVDDYEDIVNDIHIDHSDHHHTTSSAAAIKIVNAEEDEDQVIPYNDIHPMEEEDKDEIMADGEESNLVTNQQQQEEEKDEVTEKAQHVYFSKIPAHHVVVNNKSSNNKESSPPLTTTDHGAA